MKAVLYMVIPCYNEEEVLPVTSGLFLEELQLLIEKEKISEESRILFVNDGSKDRTWEIIEGLARENHTLLEFVRAATEDIRMQSLQD